MLLGSHTQLVVEGVMPDLLHVIPVCDNTVLDGVSEGEDTTLGLRLITHIRVLLTHTNHDTVRLSVLATCCRDIGESITHGDGDDRRWTLLMVRR